MLENLRRQKNYSIYKLSKMSGVPYATVNDICNDKAKLEKCSAETVYKLAQALNVSMEELLSPVLAPREDFEDFKKSIRRALKVTGDLDFIMNLRADRIIQHYYDKNWFQESFYLLGLLDYLCNSNEIPLCEEYDDLRRGRLTRPTYPARIESMPEGSKKENAMKKAREEALPEFLQFNLIESLK